MQIKQLEIGVYTQCNLQDKKKKIHLSLAYFINNFALILYNNTPAQENSADLFFNSLNLLKIVVV